MIIRCSSCCQEYDEALGMCPFCGYTEGEQAEEPFCLAPGTVIADRYVIGQMLGLGGFGITYKAWDRKLSVYCAIKEFFPSGLVNREPGTANVILVVSKREREFVYGKTRFLEEARNMAKFSSNKNIVNVYDFFETNNTAYIVMEFLDGRTLSQVLQQQNVPLPYDYCVNVGSSVCEALEAIHKENILHRDVSPDNIMICSDGNVKLFDFGAARFSAGVENRVTVIVKPGFAPPEQYDKVNRQDARTDVYALGATLYYAMTGIKPEESTNRKIDDQLVEPSAIDSSIPQNISNAIMRAMAIEQQYRFPSAQEFETALVSGKKVASAKMERARRKRKRVLGILLSFLAVAAAAGAALYIMFGQKAAAGLPAADLELWYIRTGDEEADQAKAAALEEIIQTFTGEYSNVTVTTTPVDAAEYAAALEKADRDGKLPSVFESTGLDAEKLTYAAEMTARLEKLENSYYLPQLGSPLQYPTGIVVPVIYVNSAMGTAGKLDSVSALVEACSGAGSYFEVKNEAVDLYAALYGDEIADYAADSAYDDFVSHDAFIYLGDLTDYFGIQSAMPGEYTLLMPDAAASTYRYGASWSVSAALDEKTRETAEAFAAYFNTSLAQEYMRIRNKGRDLPILKESLKGYTDVFGELEIVESYLARPFALAGASAEALLSRADHTKLETLKQSARPGVAPLPKYEDVDASKWYAGGVSFVVDKKLMDGTSKTTFSPEEQVSRRAIITALYRLAGSPEVSAAPPFTDVDPSEEAGRATAWAYENKVISGNEEKLFHGEQTASFESVLTFLYNFARAEGLKTLHHAGLEEYSDGSSVSAWAADAVMWAIDNSLVSVQAGGKIEPASVVTRARFAALLLNLYEFGELFFSPEDGTAQNDRSHGYAAAYIEKVRELAAEHCLFDLIYIDGDTTPELVAEVGGYSLSMFTYADGRLGTLASEWRYGADSAGSNEGYEYSPYRNVIHNRNTSYIELITADNYYTIGPDHEMKDLFDEPMAIWYFMDTNGDGAYNEGEPTYGSNISYHLGGRVVPKEEYEGAQLSEGLTKIAGAYDGDTMIAYLSGLSA